MSGASARAEPQRVQHRDRPGAHGQDVADDAAHPGRRALVGLDVGGVVVRLDLERHRQAAADVHHAGVLAHADQQDVLGFGRDLLAELLQVHLGRLVGAVLGPHHRVHRQLRAGRPAAQDLLDPGVLVAGQAQLGERLGPLGARLGGLHGVQRGTPPGGAHALTEPASRLVSTELKKPKPSALGPVSGSMACSGCGIRPTTLPASLQMPAMSRYEPFGLPPT